MPISMSLGPCGQVVAIVGSLIFIGLVSARYCEWKYPYNNNKHSAVEENEEAESMCSPTSTSL